MGLAEAFADETKQKRIIDDCVTLVDEEVASKSGISGFAVKAGYKAVKGVKPGFIAEVVKKLMGEWADKLDPIWAEGVEKGNAVEYMNTNKGRVADALLSVTDGKAENAKSALVKSTYGKLRGSAKKNVEDAVPRLSKLIEKHAT
jgi:hypothetical protein